jgi:hypothetical protein
MSDLSRPSTEVRHLADLALDLAGRHRVSRSGGDLVDEQTAATDWATLERDGYLILPGLLDQDTLRSIRDTAGQLLGPAGRNAFEGHRTRRVYSVLEKTRALDRLVDHPRILALLDRLLLPNYLLSQLQIIEVEPGEAPQIEHPDDGFYPVPRPRPPLGAATIWTIDDFTEDNGATVLLPGSHTWPDGRIPTPDDPRITAVMPAGSVVVFVGTLWHGAGANTTDTPRLAATTQYCEPWLRPQEAYTLSVSRSVAAGLSQDIQRMLGYSIHPPFVGMVDGMHPVRLLHRPRQ